MPLSIFLNGQERTFGDLTAPAPLTQLISELQLKADRIAVEHNGIILQRARWTEPIVASGDRLEVVHFVGGGSWKD